MDKYEIIKNISKRSGGDIYLGVVGAVRTGKSTFIKKMVAELMTFDDELASESLQYLFSTEKEYIECYYQALEEKFGSFENYIREGLGLTEEEVSEFREKYLV